MTNTPPKNGLATAGFVLALIAFIAPFALGALTFPMAVTALVFGIVGLNRSKTVGKGKGFSIWAIVLAGLSILAFAVVL